MTPAVFQLETSALNDAKFLKSSFIFVTSDTFQLEMGPYVRPAAAESASHAWTAVTRSAFVAKAPVPLILSEVLSVCLYPASGGVNEDGRRLLRCKCETPFADPFVATKAGV